MPPMVTVSPAAPALSFGVVSRYVEQKLASLNFFSSTRMTRHRSSPGSALLLGPRWVATRRVFLFFCPSRPPWPPIGSPFWSMGSTSTTPSGMSSAGLAMPPQSGWTSVPCVPPTYTGWRDAPSLKRSTTLQLTLATDRQRLCIGTSDTSGVLQAPDVSLVPMHGLWRSVASVSCKVVDRFKLGASLQPV